MWYKADNQPIDSRYGESTWLTDFIQPRNPDIQLLSKKLTAGLDTSSKKVAALWSYVSQYPYVETVKTIRIAGDGQITQDDTWLYPAETLRVKKSNCANRSFLLASLVKNILPNPGDVYCVMGKIKLDGIGAHAWVRTNVDGVPFILETTQPDINRALIPVAKATAYQEALAFDEKEVYTVGENVSPAMVLNSRFGVCALEFLKDYICERCLSL